MHTDDSFNAGRFPTSVVGDPGVQGAVVTGIHGMGVSTPMAAVVAAATVGLAMLLHIPKGMIFTMGAKSMMLAAGKFPTITRLTGSTVSVEGAIPNVHVNSAPEHTCRPMAVYLI
jgi:hypothetical protein